MTQLCKQEIWVRDYQSMSIGCYVMPTGHSKTEKRILPTFFSELWFLCLQTNILHYFTNIQNTYEKNSGRPKATRTHGIQGTQHLRV